MAYGYNGISMREIAEAVGVSKAGLYYHFKDKEDVVWTAFRDIFQELEQGAHQQLDRSMPQVEYYGLLNIFRHAQVNSDLYKVMFGRQGSALLTGYAQDFLAKAFLYDIRNAAEPHEVDFNIPEEIEAQLLTGMISRLLYWWLETPNKYSAEQMATMTYEALYRKAPPPT